MSETIKIEKLKCPKCGSNIYDKQWAEKYIYICQGEDKTSIVGKCWTVQCLCKTCNKIYPEDNFGKHGDVYECKTCGNINWPYTDRKRSNQELLNQIQSMDSKLDRLLKSNNIFK